ncbi:MAG: glycosyltransferase family 4 protein [Ignavibacteria bacterium]
MSGSEKILLITTEFPPGPGGIGNHAFNLAKYLNLNDFKIKVLTVSDFTDRESEKDFDAKQKFEIVRFKRFKNRIKTYRERLITIRESVKKESYSHIIFSGRFALYSSLFLGNYHSKTKFIAIAHGGDVNADNPIEKNYVNKALLKMDLIIPVSNFSKGKVSKAIDPKKILVIPNGFDFPEIEKIKVTEKQFNNGHLNLVSVGTIWPRKGHHNVLKAFPKILQKYPEAKYNIVGRLADTSKVKNFFEDEKLRDHLIVHGQIPSENMHKILDDSQIFILLSEIQPDGDFEGFGIAVIEGNYFGLPAIGSKDSGLEDAISNGVSGMLVDPHDPAEISDAIQKIKDNYFEFSKGARQWAMEHHWSKIIHRYIKAIKNLK